MANTEHSRFSATELAALIRPRQISPVEVAEVGRIKLAGFAA